MAGKYSIWPEANAGKTHVGRTAFAFFDRFARFARSLQSASREPCRMFRRPVSVVGAERPSRLCVLINPILPRAIHRDQAGENLEILLLQPETIPSCSLAAHHSIFPRASEPNGIETR